MATDTVNLTLCTDCALVYGAGYTPEELGADTHGAMGVPWDEAAEHIESWEGVANVVLGDVDEPRSGVFTCTLCDSISYGREYLGTTTVTAG